ncbi:hypothetical protein [Leptothoe sp. PORK10 BA2]|uniref:hypothetical protein n=1 Tax=Leptothoe sp. PORK10 BA2 TaxID=3110254 RepID=UPI002B208E79|nr:hypothetical protein [Leptothoe sp. PORK10 BA2]MEA5465007.1 hypothetical protein [Leptothoe sp. PORK10 BA2]
MHVSQQYPRLSSTVPCDLAVKILKRIPPEHRQSFTPQQIAALQNALGDKRQQQSKPSVFKVTLGPFYLSLAAGRAQKISGQGRSSSMLVPVLCVMVSMVGMSCVTGLMKLRYGYQAAHATAAFQTKEQKIHPSVLPFRTEQDNCEKNGAVWVEQECVDHGHDPTF